MKAIILKEFWDKNDDTRYKVDDVVEFSKNRFEELLKLGLIAKTEKVS